MRERILRRVVYVNKKWLESIDDAAHLFVVHTNLKGNYALMLARDKNLIVSSDFVHADVRRVPATVTKKSGGFIPAKISTSAIAAIFYLTEDDFKKLTSQRVVNIPNG